MKKKNCLKPIIGALLLSIALSGCNPVGDTNEIVNTTPPDVEVWGAYATAKVIQDSEYNINHKKLAAAIDVQSCRGEEEDGQLIITANERVDWYSLKTAELKNENGDVFSTDNIWVYNQFYHEIYLKSQGVGTNQYAYPLGYTPDALAPQEGSERNKENFIEAGNNQGITVTFNVLADQAPGVYTGRFSLIIDGYEKSIPVRLTVWDIDNSYAHGYMAWDNWGGYAAAEKDNINGLGYQRATTKLEYDYWLSKRQTLMRVPDHFNGPEALAECVAEYWSDPHFNSFGFDDMYGDKDKMAEYIMALVNIADRDQINYISAAYFYEKEIDEATPGSDRMANLEKWVRNAYETFNEIADFVQSSEDLFSEDEDLKQEVVQSIRDIPYVLTVPYWELSDEILEMANCLCPQIDRYTNEVRRDYYSSRVEEGNYSAWTYTCMFPTYPRPSQAIDDYSLGIRVLGWMRKDYNIEGYLNWDGNMQNWNGNTFYNGLDQYEDVLRLYLGGGLNQYLNGDGFLTYPGMRYDQEEPVGSIRMNAFRDMQEDYDMLCVFEELYDSLVKKYGADTAKFNANNLLNSLYDSLYESLNYYTEEELVLQAREQVANWIEGMQETGLLFNYSKDGDKVKLSFYSDADEIYVNGNKVNGSAVNDANFYQKLVNLGEYETKISIRAVKDGESKIYTFDLGQKNHILVDSELLKAEQVIVSDGSTFDAQTGLFTMRTGGKTYTDQLTFRLQAKVAFAEPVALSDINTLQVEYFNDSDFDVNVTLAYYSGTSSSSVETFVVKANSSLVLTDLQVFNSDWNKQYMDGIVLIFENLDENQKAYPDRNFRLGDIFYTKAKGGN